MRLWEYLISLIDIRKYIVAIARSKVHNDMGLKRTFNMDICILPFMFVLSCLERLLAMRQYPFRVTYQVSSKDILYEKCILNLNNRTN
jgi:hypothetical protein